MAATSEHSLTFNTKFFYYPLRLPWLIVADGRNFLTASVINLPNRVKVFNLSKISCFSDSIAAKLALFNALFRSFNSLRIYIQDFVIYIKFSIKHPKYHIIKPKQHLRKYYTGCTRPNETKVGKDDHWMASNKGLFCYAKASLPPQPNIVEH